MKADSFLETPTAFVIFGVTGDLTHRKLIPALYNLLRKGKLGENFHVIGFARRDWTDETFRQVIRDSLKEQSGDAVDAAVVEQLVARSRYIRSSFNEDSGYQSLSVLFAELKIENALYYLATPPDSYREVIRHLGRCDLQDCLPGWTRIVVEKPFGRDLSSALELDEEIHRVFKEKQIFRIDHYLGKETVQNILVFRFANGIFEPLWNRNYIDHVQITVAETVGVGSRAGYYDTAGAIRDVFQNHMLQLLTLTAMEAPIAFNADAVRDEKMKILKSLRPLTGKEALENTFRAQYVGGFSGSTRMNGYKEEPGTPSNSITETYFAARLTLDSWRWAGVPFFVRTGKRMPVRATEIAIFFKQVPLPLFNWKNMAGQAPNVLAMNLQPNEAIELTFGAKIPGPENHVAPVKMTFDYQSAFGEEPPEAYERLLLDSLQGDATLFTRSDEVRAQWEITGTILDAWKEMPVQNLPVYEAGTWGPPGADEFIERTGRKWRRL